MVCNWTDEEIKGKVLYKLTRMGKFKHSHTSIDNLPKGFPKEIRGVVKHIMEELVKERILLLKPTNYGKEVSLNDELSDKICFYISCYIQRTN